MTANKNNKIKLETRKAGWAQLKDFCSFSYQEETDFIEVTEWINNEGFDVEVETKHSMKNFRFQLTYGQFDALKKIIKEIDK